MSHNGRAVSGGLDSLYRYPLPGKKSVYRNEKLCKNDYKLKRGTKELTSLAYKFQLE